MTVTDRLIDLIRNNPRFSEAKPHYVSIYKKEQCYGGPEEGGWWKTYYVLEGSVSFDTQEQADGYVEHVEIVAKELKNAADKSFRDTFVNSHCDDIDYQDDFCVGETCGSEDYIVIVEDVQGSLDNSNEPIGHYE